MTFKDHFSSYAADYRENRPQYPPKLFRYLTSLVPQHEKVWDCATGNGQAAVGLSDHFKEVMATDASADQISNGTPRLNISYGVASAESSGLEDHSIDLVTVATDREFKRVVLVEYPRRGVKAIGFLTGQFEDEEGKQQDVVYIPTTPNPTSGYLAIISIDEIYPTDLKVDQAMKLIFSGGIFASQALGPNTDISKIATDTK